jgi:uncharacterized protein (TIGR03083 family)
VTTEAPVRLTELRKPALDRDVAMRLAATEYARFAAQQRTLSAEEWSTPTACSEWDVRGMVAHVIGMAEMAASPVEAVKQMAAIRKADGMMINALTDHQMRKHVHRSPAELVALAEKVGPKAARGRRRTPRFVRGRAMPEQPIEPTGRITERWAMGYLLDVILTRDTWMHRSDVALAVGRDMQLTPDHDGVLIADVVAEWAQRHGQPCTLSLTGPAGGAWTFGDGGPSYELAAVQFCRILSGRGTGEGMLATPVPF